MKSKKVDISIKADNLDYYNSFKTIVIELRKYPWKIKKKKCRIKHSKLFLKGTLRKKWEKNQWS